MPQWYDGRGCIVKSYYYNYPNYYDYYGYWLIISSGILRYTHEKSKVPLSAFLSPYRFLSWRDAVNDRRSKLPSCRRKPGNFRHVVATDGSGKGMMLSPRSQGLVHGPGITSLCSGIQARSDGGKHYPEATSAKTVAIDPIQLQS